MIQFANTITIERPIHEVFEYLADLEHTPEWNWAIEETVKTTPGPVKAGTTYRQVRHTPRRETEILQIESLEPSDLITVGGTLAGIPARLRYQLSEPSSGETVVHNTVELEPTGVLRIVAPLATRRIEQSVADNLGALKGRLERADN